MIPLLPFHEILPACLHRSDVPGCAVQDWEDGEPSSCGVSGSDAVELQLALPVLHPIDRRPQRCAAADNPASPHGTLSTLTCAHGHMQGV